ncbi:MAG: hypothetical protein HS114_24955 [Anaerolineales bacterium]|nr:hypothetical protein [Anaerolineales bacterium]
MALKINGKYIAGAQIGDKSSDFELDHLEIANTSLAGIYAKTLANCSNGSTNIYDHDGDGQTHDDPDDIINRSTFTQYNSVLHDNYIHQVRAEGFYVGSSFYSEGSRLAALRNHSGVSSCSQGCQNLQQHIR